MMRRASLASALALAATAGVLFLSACAEMPVGPSVAVMPGPNKPFDVFVQEDQLCRGWAAHSIGLPGHDAAAQAMVGSTVAGAAIGAIAGAIAGGDRNVRAGAAMGTVVGAAAGSGQAATTSWQSQRRYDVAYQQCMYSKGNFVSSYPYAGYRYPATLPSAPPPPPAPP
jgi:hypothetical protein